MREDDVSDAAGPAAMLAEMLNESRKKVTKDSSSRVERKRVTCKSTGEEGVNILVCMQVRARPREAISNQAVVAPN